MTDIFLTQVHSACSESFYKNELETQIKTEPSKSAEERRKMMDMLKRFEEESADDAIALENEEDEDELAGRLENVDLGTSHDCALLDPPLSIRTLPK